MNLAIYELTRGYTITNVWCDQHLADRTRVVPGDLTGKHGWTAELVGPATEVQGCVDCALERYEAA